MQALPLPKAIYDKLVAAKALTVTLNFRGGSDEGFLDTCVDCEDGYDEELSNEVNEWADAAYDYNGNGGDGDYGDDVVYDLKEGTATVTGWHDAPIYDDPEIFTLEVEEAEDA